MTHRFSEIMFTPAVKLWQTELGSRAAYEKFEQPDAPARNIIGPDEQEFIAARDSFYMASVSETGWPYVQHRGGPAGFLKVLDTKTLGFADFRGNRQYVSLGNLSVESRVSLFLMDYVGRRRLKILGHVEVTHDPEKIAGLGQGGYRAQIERGLLVHLDAFDWNCPQHITPRFTEAEIAQGMQKVEAAIAALRTENADLKARLASMLEPGHPGVPD